MRNFKIEKDNSDEYIYKIYIDYLGLYTPLVRFTIGKDKKPHYKINKETTISSEVKLNIRNFVKQETL